MCVWNVFKRNKKDDQRRRSHVISINFEQVLHIMLVLPLKGCIGNLSQSVR